MLKDIKEKNGVMVGGNLKGNNEKMQVPQLKQGFITLKNSINSSDFIHLN